MRYKELVYWNQNAYGNAIKLRRGLLRGLIALFCIFTPGTNCLLPFVKRMVKRDIMIRY